MIGDRGMVYVARFSMPLSAIILMVLLWPWSELVIRLKSLKSSSKSFCLSAFSFSAPVFFSFVESHYVYVSMQRRHLAIAK